MKYTLEAKPTFYNGIHFRSKLEAQWAAFFDLTEIKYEYEPENFNDWQPDFLIHGIKPIYVEVKPYITKDIIERYKKKCEEVIKSGTCEGPFTTKEECFGKYYESIYYNVKTDHNVILITNPLGHEKDYYYQGDYYQNDNPFGVILGFNGHGLYHDQLIWIDNFNFCTDIYNDGLLGYSEKRESLQNNNVWRMWNEAKNIIQTQII